MNQEHIDKAKEILSTWVDWNQVEENTRYYSLIEAIANTLQELEARTIERISDFVMEGHSYYELDKNEDKFREKISKAIRDLRQLKEYNL